MKLMTPEFDSRIADWLEDDPDKAPSIVLETVVSALPSIPQRRNWRVLLRFNQMPRFSIVAGFVLVAAVGVSAWIAGGRNGLGSAPPTPAPTTASTSALTPAPTVTPASAPAVSPRVLTGLDQEIQLPAGTYRISTPFQAPLTIVLPDGWRATRLEANVLNLSGSQKDATGMDFFTSLDVIRPNKLYSDPCQPDGEPTAVSDSVDDLVSALTSLEGFTAGPVESVVIDGVNATTFTLDNSIDPQICLPGPKLLSYDRFGLDEPSMGSFDAHDRIWVLDAENAPLVIDVRTFGGADTAQQLVAEQIVETIDFD